MLPDAVLAETVDGVLLKRRIRIQIRIVVAAGEQPPILDLFLKAEGVGQLG